MPGAPQHGDSLGRFDESDERARELARLKSRLAKLESRIGALETEQEELRAKLEAVFDARGSKDVFLRADRDAPYGVVVKAMAAVRQAGSTRLGIVTEAEE